MTMNCQCGDEYWCLECVSEMHAENERLRSRAFTTRERLFLKRAVEDARRTYSIQGGNRDFALEDAYDSLLKKLDASLDPQLCESGSTLP